MWRLDDAMKKISSTLDFAYLKILRFSLKLICFWPSELFGEKTWKISKYRGLLIISVMSYTLYSIIDFFKDHYHSLSMLEIGHMCLTMFMTTLALSRCVVLPLNKKYKDILIDFLTSMHLYYHSHKSDYAKAMHIRIHKICHYVSLGMLTQMYVGLTLFNTIPIYLNYSTGKLKHKFLENSTFELAVFINIPKDATTNRDSFFIAYAFNWCATFICSNCVISTDLLLFLMIFHLYGHFKILLNLMATFPRPADTRNELTNETQHNQMFSKIESEDIHRRLKECINYHTFILNFTNSMSETFGPTLLVYFTFHQVSCCLLLLECSEMSADALFRYGPLTVIVFQALIQISIIFEIIGTVSEKLKEAIYEMPWESMDLRNRKLVLFFLMNVQTPVHVKAMGITDVGLQTMATILKTSVSYFTFLRTVPGD